MKSRTTVFLVLVLPSLTRAQVAEIEALPPAATNTSPAALNQAGTTVGFVSTAGPNGSKAFRFDGTSVTYLDPPPGLLAANVTVFGINDLGHALGSTKDHITWLNSTYATVWFGDTPVLLDSMVTSGAPLFLQRAIDGTDQGAILGVASQFGDGVLDRGFLFENGNITEIYGAPQVTDVRPEAINASKTVVGSGNATVAGLASTYAFRWDNGVFTILEVPALPNVQTSALDINDAGDICGTYASTPPFQSVSVHAAVWKNGVFAALPDPGSVFSVANAINDAGDVVGYTNAGPNFARLWRNGQMIDLTSLLPENSGWFLQQANDINDEGVIVGSGLFNGSLRGFRMRLCPGEYSKPTAGCPGTGPTPTLDGGGCPEQGKSMSLVVAGGLPNAAGVLLFGAGNGALPFVPNCSLGVAPLIPVVFPVVTSGAGGVTLSFTVPVTAPNGTVYAQALLADPAAAGGASATNVLRIVVN